MPYIVPNSNIQILNQVPIDMSNTHTLYFSGIVDQVNYFASKVKYSFTSCTYTRQTPGYVKLPVSADRVFDCNYLRYQNTYFSDKWFYAFITNVEYISNNVCGIHFIIDNLQTWFFEMHLGECYIDRQHSTTDNPGDNLIPENLETGEYMYVDNNLDWSKTFTSYDVLALTTFSSTYTTSGEWVFTREQGTYRFGIYSGLNIRVFRQIENADTVTLLSSFLTAATETYGEENGIVSLVMIPHDSLDEQLNPAQISQTIPKITTLDGYAPVNKKMLTSPYCFIELSNCEGATAVLPQEYFGGTNPNVCQFMITFNITAAPVAFCVPINYKGSEYNYSEGMYINNFPQCSYNTDLFKAYMAQSLVGTLGQNFTDLINSAVGAPTSRQMTDASKYRGLSQGSRSSIKYYDRNTSENIADITRGFLKDGGAGVIGGLGAVGTVGAVLTGNAGDILGQVYNSMSTLYSKSIAATHNNGANTPDYLCSNRLKGFWLFHRTIRNEFARKIDAYFTRFGYAQHTIAVPNIRARTRFTFVKTVDCHVDGNIPSEAVDSIQSIFDGGITFWADHDNVGNYSLDNPIYTGG